MKHEFSQQIFEQNPHYQSPVVPCGQTDRMELTVAFRNFAYAPKIIGNIGHCIIAELVNTGKEHI